MYATLLVLHVLGATIWTGGHLLLASIVLPRALRQGSAESLLEFESGFEKLGMPALVVQITTGMMLARHYLPNPSLWFDGSAPFSAIIKAKMLLLLLTACLAVDARFRVIPKLRLGGGKACLWDMAAHIYLVTALSVGFVIVGISVRTGWLY